MPSGSNVDKNAKILKFITDVINATTADIAREDSDLTGAYASLQGNTPVVSTASLSVTPKSLSNIADPTEQSSVRSRSEYFSGSSLADLFLSYGQRLTAVRRCTMNVRMKRSVPGTGAALPDLVSNIWTNEITALSSLYAMDANTFKTTVANATAPADPVSALGPGIINADSAVDDLIAKIRQVIVNHYASSVTVNVTACHSACHSSCHGSRGRR